MDQAAASASASSRAPKPDGHRPQNSQYRFGLGFISGHRRLVVLIKCKYALAGSRKRINSADRFRRTFLPRPLTSQRDRAINATAWELIKAFIIHNFLKSDKD